MNKKQLKKIKDAMTYEGHPEQKRNLRNIKSQYSKLPHNQKAQFISEVQSFFDGRKKS
jgi:hypothetical protein|tara:strand:+ start:200 stop:373 length:174 start_codon:yes stop_codon:yes gene_type:complete